MRTTKLWKSVFQRRSVRRPLLGGLAFLLSLTMSVPAWAVVFSNPAPITINDGTSAAPASLYPSNIIVSGMTGTVTNMTVTLNNINHTFTPDIDVLLVSPTGANMIILSDVGSGTDITNVTVTLDDAAATSMTAATLVSGTYKPTNITAGDTFPAPAPAASANTTFAAAFTGIDPNGTWNLYVVDDVSLDVGSIGNGWSMSIATSGTGATTFSNSAPMIVGDSGKGRATPYASTIAVSGLTGAITDVNVTLTNFNHSFPDDVDILLVGPTGKRIILMSDTGGSNVVAGANLTFDDAAAGGLPDSTAISSGSFKPTNIGTADPFPDTLPNGQIAGGEAYPCGTTAGPATLASVYNGTNPNGTWSLYVVDDAGGQTGTITGGWSVDITAGGTFGAKRFTNGDFDGDGRTDVAVFSPSSQNWQIRNSSTYANRVQPLWGTTGDVAVPGDYDGDAKTDIAVWRPSEGNWYIIPSTTSVPSVKNWGASSDKPVPADYDGDGKTDIAVWRPSEGNWYIIKSATNTLRVVNWGASSDTPVRGHFTGANGADFTVYRPSDGNWYILDNTASAVTVVNWGASTDVLVPGDYDADGKTDVAVWRPSDGTWYVIQSSTNTVLPLRSWGAATDIPVPGDYDGDSQTDFAVYRPSDGNWYILNRGTTTNALRLDNLGHTTDTLVPSTY